MVEANKVPSPIRKNTFKKSTKAKAKPKFEIPLKIVSSNGIHIIWAEGFFWHMIKDVESGRYPDNLMYGKVSRRVSQEDNSHMLNDDGWWKIAIIRNKDEDNCEDTHEDRMEILNSIKLYLHNHPENRFNTYVVDEETADETPEDGMLALDHYIMDDEIVQYIKDKHGIEDTDTTWARTNRSESMTYFSGPTFPYKAKQELGYSDVA